MTPLKTTQNDKCVITFLENVEPTRKREDALYLLELMNEITNVLPKMWGDSIIGYGQYHYTSSRSSQNGDWFAVGFSPRKTSLTLYLMQGFTENTALLEKLGKFKLGKACLYINKLSDVNIEILKQLITDSFNRLNGQFIVY